MSTVLFNLFIAKTYVIVAPFPASIVTFAEYVAFLYTRQYNNTNNDRNLLKNL